MLFSLQAFGYGAIFFPQEEMTKLQQCVALQDPIFESAFQALIQDANSDLSAGPYSVINKKIIPPSNDKHDYMSQARYWWPSSSGSHRIPYIQRDGELNPEIWGDAFDFNEKMKMQQACVRLSFAYQLTSEERYAQKAIELLRVWFINPDTKMNPNLNHGQSIPGICSGRGNGIIETSQFPLLFDAISFLARLNTGRCAIKMDFKSGRRLFRMAIA